MNEKLRDWVLKNKQNLTIHKINEFQVLMVIYVKYKKRLELLAQMENMLWQKTVWGSPFHLFVEDEKFMQIMQLRNNFKHMLF